MMLFAYAALLQAAQTAPPITMPQAASGAPIPAWRAAGRAWSDCVKGRIDARLQSADTPESVTDAAMAGCTGELETVRSTIAAERGPEVAAANVERVRTSGRSMFIAYVATRRSPAPAAGQGPGR